MATSKELRALIVLAGKIDPSLQSAMLRASGESRKLAQNAEKSIKSLNKVAGSVKSAIMGSTMALAGLAATAISVNKIIDIADTWTTVRSRVGLVNDSVQQQQASLESIYDIAQKTRQAYAATGDLYYKIASNAELLNISDDKVLQLTNTVNKALRIGGGTAQQSEAAILQFGQALGSGRLQGEELTSLLENAPRLARAVAEGLGTNVGALRKLGSEGLLTSDIIIKALQSQSEVIDQEFTKMPTTIRQALTYANNAFGKFIDDVGRKTKIFDLISQGIIKSVDKAVNYLNTHYINNPEFQNLPDITSKITFIIDDLLKTFNSWLANGGQEQLNRIGAGLVSALATSIEIGAPRLAQAGLAVGGALGEAIINAAKDYVAEHWKTILLGRSLANNVDKVTNALNYKNYNYDTKGLDTGDYFGSGYASGGIATHASIFGEAGPEMAIPLQRTPRSLGLLNQTARILGVGGSSSNNVEINININAASGNPQQIGTAVKEVIIDVMEEYFGDKVRVSYG